MDSELTAIPRRRTLHHSPPGAVRTRLLAGGCGAGGSRWRRREGCLGRRCLGGGLGLGLLLVGLLLGLLELLLLVVEARDGRRGFLEQCLVLRPGQKAGRRIVAGLLPGRDHLARARAERAV